MNKNKVSDQVSMLSILTQVLKHKSLHRAYLNFFAGKLVNLEGIVLDLGCGQYPSYQQYIYKEKVRCIIRADSAFEMRPDLVLSLEHELPFMTESADIILLFNVLEHIYCYHSLIKEIYRVLKCNGRAYRRSIFNRDSP